MKKLCPKCKINKDISCFSKDKYRKSGLDCWCKFCRKSITKQWTIENPQRHKKNIENFKKNNTGYMTKYINKKRKADPLFRIRGNLGCALRDALKINKKSKKTIYYLGCSIDKLKAHLESQFKEGMSWNNYGNGLNNWSIDHILPCASFDHSDEEQVKKCWHYTNLQPMWHTQNLKKGKKILCV